MNCPNCDTVNPDNSKYCRECATSLTGAGEAQPSFTRTLETPTSRLAAGTTFAGRYEIKELLGAGGMGEVYKAQDTELKESVALKLLRPEIASDAKILDRFRNELRLARKITHENVCRMHELMVDEGTPFITMEYVDGENLKSFIRRSEFLNKEDILSFARQIAEGLVRAHKLGVIHRDLKPQNIMVLKDRGIKIMDFGIARSLEARGVTEAGMIIGTLEYMSPEQAEGRDTDQRSDIYSLGIILYEMATGRVPFEADSVVGVAMKHKTEAPLHPQKLNPKLPPEIAQIILRCLEKAPDDRYATADALLEDFKRLDEGLAPLTRDFSKKKKLLTPIAAATGFLLIAVLVWRLFLSSPSSSHVDERPSLAVVAFENRTGDDSLARVCDVVGLFLTGDLMQSKLMHVSSEDQVLEALKSLELLETPRMSNTDLQRKPRKTGK